jgi:hypothetical protein
MDAGVVSGLLQVKPESAQFSQLRPNGKPVAEQRVYRGWGTIRM